MARGYICWFRNFLLDCLHSSLLELTINIANKDSYVKPLQHPEDNQK